ncbi:MAG: pseudouridine synthase [Nitrospirae bacterium]|nr:pseudouridine synthase [Nitrospirota bacterium]MDA1303600.1 pseudouridine synthase [Nitrospirota bacterium]
MSNPPDISDTSVRLQKVIAASGLSSRRAAEALIREGKVTVNGEVVRVLGTCINPATDHVKVDGTHIETAEPEVFILLNKPPGCVTTMNDPVGRGTVADLLGRVKVRVFPVGRLDFDAEGLLLLTNNGLVAQACLHPRYHVPKTYVLKVSGVFLDEEIKMLKEGVRLEDGVTAPADVKKSGKAKANSWLEITIREGRKHQIKRMIEACGHRVIKLKRIRFGPLQLGDLPVGTFRYATDAEANALRAVLHRSMTGETSRAPRRKPYLKNRVKPGITAAAKILRKPLRPILSRDRAKPRVSSAQRPSAAQAEFRPAISKRPLTTSPVTRNAPLGKVDDRRPSLPKRPFTGRGVTPKFSATKGTKRSSASSSRPSNVRGTSGKPQAARGGATRTAFSKRSPASSSRPSNVRGTSAKPQGATGSVRREDFPKRSSARPGDSSRSQPTQGNAKRSTFAKRPSNPRGASGKFNTSKGNERRSGSSKGGPSSRGTSGKAQPFKGKERRPAFSKSPSKSGPSSGKRPSTKGTSSRATFSKRGSGPTRNTSAKRRTQKG